MRVLTAAAVNVSTDPWLRPRHARRVLQEQGANDNAIRFFSGKLTRDRNSPEARLISYWALHAIGGLDETAIKTGLADGEVYIRAWTIQLATEDEKPSPATLAKFAEMAKSDPSPVVRLYLASAVQRLQTNACWPILEGLVSHEEDATDPNLPYMVWYAAEPFAPLDPSRAMSLAISAKLPTFLPFMTRRVAGDRHARGHRTAGRSVAEGPAAEATALAARRDRRGIEGPPPGDDAEGLAGGLSRVAVRRRPGRPRPGALGRRHIRRRLGPGHPAIGLGGLEARCRPEARRDDDPLEGPRPRTASSLAGDCRGGSRGGRRVFCAPSPGDPGPRRV